MSKAGIRLALVLNEALGSQVTDLDPAAATIEVMRGEYFNCGAPETWDRRCQPGSGVPRGRACAVNIRSHMASYLTSQLSSKQKDRPP
jgi:hypothetical protein